MRRGEGKIEVIACRDEILDLLRKGYPVARIREILLDAGKISSSRQQFERWVNRLVRPLVEIAVGRPSLSAKTNIQGVQSSAPSTSSPDQFPQPFKWNPGHRVADWE